jgi:drug/metabolite transporter (DMT)-like permease
MPDERKKSYIYGLIAILFWSTIATAFSLALDEVGVFHLMVGAGFIAIVCLTIMLAFQRRLSFFKNLRPKHILNSLLLGLLNPFLYYAILLKAYQILPAQEAMVLNYIWPISLVLLSIPLLKQKIGWKSILFILVSFAGVLVIASKGEFSSLAFTNWYGDLLALSSSVAWALFWIFNMKGERDETEKMLLNFIFGFLFSILGLLVFEEPQIPSLRGILAISYIGIFELGITFVLWLKALKWARTTDSISQLVFISPFLSLLFINLVIGEKIIPSTIYGLVLIVVGIILQQRLNYRKA